MNHYSTLGVDKNASQDEIKRAFRKLASQHHPDKGGDTQKFQEIQAAYDVLGDPEKRKQYDNPAPDWAGQGQPGGFSFNFGSGPQFGDFFQNIFGQGFANANQRRPYVRMTVWISLIESVKGGSRQIALGTQSGNNTVEVEIPIGINDGDAVQYSGIAPGGNDLLIQFRIHPDPVFRKQGLDLHKDQKVPLWDLLLGGDIEIQTLFGSVLSMRVPAKTSPGTIMRIRNQGIKNKQGAQGDLYIHLQMEMPKNLSQELIDAIQKYR